MSSGNCCSNFCNWWWVYMFAFPFWYYIGWFGAIFTGWDFSQVGIRADMTDAKYFNLIPELYNIAPYFGDEESIILKNSESWDPKT